MRVPRPLLLALSLCPATLGGCDPDLVKTPPTKAEGKGDAKGEPGTPLSALPKAPDGETKRAEELAAEDKGACLSACGGGEALSATDQATCELLCSTEAHADAKPAGTVRARFDLCRDRCSEESKKADVPTCRLTCAAAAPATVPGLSAEAQRCYRPCLDALEQCEETCGDAESRATDRSTCGLNCDAAAGKCLEACSTGPT